MLNRLFDGAGSNATRADAYAFGRSIDEGADRLEVHVKNALGPVIGMADVVTNHASFSADITYSGHVDTPFSLCEYGVHATMSAAGLTSERRFQPQRAGPGPVNGSDG